MRERKTELVTTEAGKLSYTLRDDVGPIGRYFYQNFFFEKDLTNMETKVAPFVYALLRIPGVNFVYLCGSFLTINHSVLFDQNEINEKVKTVLEENDQGELSCSGELEIRMGVSYGIDEMVIDVREMLTQENCELFIKNCILPKDTLACRIASRILGETNADQVVIKTRQIIVKHKDYMDEIEKEARQILKEELKWD